MLAKGPIKKILLYVDGTEECVTAAQYGIALAKQHQAALKAIYCVNISLLEELVKARIFVKIEEMDYQQDLEQDGKRYLNYITEMARAKNLEIETELTKGVVNKVVTDYIDQEGIDLLVMGELDPILSRKESFHDESELIFRKARCSVIVVKNPDHAETIYNEIEEG